MKFVSDFFLSFFTIFSFVIVTTFLLAFCLKFLAKLCHTKPSPSRETFNSDIILNHNDNEVPKSYSQLFNEPPPCYETALTLNLPK
ncbi:unnamed protein product [Brachionus calyciflorus]|uniref:Uncharacterized protein n=1 Tax=Brachionus calyciflorus TaxID=104777 RepID=A0A814CX62_9BILA|nr:unnamed protein product [Brachionus calyciflorus]